MIAKGNDWSKPGNFVGNGAYVTKAWIPNDHITLAKNPRFYDAAHVRIDVVNYYPTQDTEAGLRRFLTVTGHEPKVIPVEHRAAGEQGRSQPAPT